MAEASEVGPTWLLRTDAEHDIGLGHLQRMIALARSARGRGITAQVALKYHSKRARRLLAAAGLKTLEVDPSFSLEQEQRWLMDAVRSSRAQALVWDVSHGRTPRDGQALARYFGGFPDDVVTCLVDGMAEHSLAAEVGGRPRLDVLVVPYVGAAVDTGQRAARSLVGPRYAIVDEELRLCAERRSRAAEDIPRHLLVTAGGSDPCGITELALKSFFATSLLRHLEVRVVFGPLFGRARTQDLRRLCTDHAGLMMLEAPPSLCEVMVWADLAVSATGLTKYELALFGIPAVFISGDANQHEAHRSFSQRRTGIDLGVMDSSTGEVLIASLTRLVHEPELRLRLSARGQALVDGRGADRVVSALLSAAGTGERRARR